MVCEYYIEAFDRLFPDDVYTKRDDNISRTMEEIRQLIHSDQLCVDTQLKDIYLALCNERYSNDDECYIIMQLRNYARSVCCNMIIAYTIPKGDIMYPPCNASRINTQPVYPLCGDKYINIFSENPCMANIRAQRVLDNLYKYMDVREELLKLLTNDIKHTQDTSIITNAIRCIIYSYEYDIDPNVICKDKLYLLDDDKISERYSVLIKE